MRARAQRALIVLFLCSLFAGVGVVHADTGVSVALFSPTWSPAWTGS